MELNEKFNKRSFGTEGEAFTAEFLERNGFKIIKRNFRFRRLGEIDIIAWEKEYICFIEVKTRSSSFFGSPSEAVDIRKQQKIKNLAILFLKQYNLTDSFIRFDIAEVLCKKAANRYIPASVNLIRNAF